MFSRICFRLVKVSIVMISPKFRDTDHQFTCTFHIIVVVISLRFVSRLLFAVAVLFQLTNIKKLITNIKELICGVTYLAL